jgi:ACR3 family arsenite efflux pump ArsB
MTYLNLKFLAPILLAIFLIIFFAGSKSRIDYKRIMPYFLAAVTRMKNLALADTKNSTKYCMA